MRFIKFKTKAVLAFVCLSLCQTVLYAQTKVTILKGKVSITEVFKQIEKQSVKSIAYNSSKLKNHPNLDLDIQSQPLEVALEIALSGTDLTYKIEGDYIMIVDKVQQASTKTIQGVVLDSDMDNEPLIGANIAIRNAGVGTITNLDGKFTLSNVAKGTVIEISYIGYKTVNITVADKNDYVIKLAPDSKMLSEVVVTALGIKRETKALSYNVQEVK